MFQGSESKMVNVFTLRHKITIAVGAFFGNFLNLVQILDERHRANFTNKRSNSKIDFEEICLTYYF